MAALPSTARVVIIGGGAVGASCLYHLAKAGWTDCLLLEKDELTAGSTWHAAGNVPTFSNSWLIMNLQRYSTELYRGLGEAVDYPMNYHVSGSVRLAHSAERMREFERAAGMGRYQGLDIELLDLEGLKNRYPFMETHDLAGGLYDPDDGDIDPAQLTQALAKGARTLGATIIRHCGVTGIRREGGEWVIETPQGEVRCEKFVNAAGYRAQEIGAMVGRFVPMMVMSHQYLLTEPVAELEAWSKETGGKLPILRDVDSSYYLRQEKTGFNLGPYERNCRGHWMGGDDPMPDDFSFQLFPDDLDRIEWHINDAIERVPLLGTSGVSRVINGPIPYAPDGLPLVGPMPGVPDAYEACVFTFGIAQSGGAGKILAEWVTEGSTEWDSWAVDPRRYTAYADQDYSNVKGMEVYGHEYAIHFPHHAWPAGRDKKHSPLHGKLESLGAQFGAYNGWERANWFAKPGDDISEEATQTFDRDGPWQPRVREECLAVRDGVGALDLCGFSRFDLSGGGTAAWLSGLTASRLPKPGRVGLAYFADARGRVVTEMSVLRHAEDHFTLITAAAAQWHDYEILRDALPADGSISLTDHTEEVSTLVVTGPQSRALFAGLTDGDLARPWLTHQKATVAGRAVSLVRVSFAGELGWEVHAPNADMPAIYDAVLEAGATPFGMFALDSMRLEKGYRAWKGDLSTDYTLLEAGLNRFIDWEKPAFTGREALLAEKQRGAAKSFVAMTVEAGVCDAPYMSTLWHDGEVVGETTSGGWGHRVDASLALGMLRADLAQPGTVVEVEIFGARHAATVLKGQSAWDPANERLRA